MKRNKSIYEKIQDCNALISLFLPCVTALIIAEKHGGLDKLSVIESILTYINIPCPIIIYSTLALLMIPKQDNLTQQEKDIHQSCGALLISLIPLTITVLVDFMILPALINTITIFVMLYTSVYENELYRYSYNKDIKIILPKKREDIWIDSLPGYSAQGFYRWMDDDEKYKEIQSKRKALYDIIDEIGYKNYTTPKEEIKEYKRKIEELSPTIADTLMILAMLDEWVRIKDKEENEKQPKNCQN